MTDWTTPRSYTIGELITKLILETEIRDHLNAIWVGTTAGDMDYYISGVRKGRIPKGTNGQILQEVAGVPTWVSGERYFIITLNSDIALTTGDLKGWFTIPAAFNGWNITSILASRTSGTGVPAFQLRNVTDSVDVLSTKVTIDSGETTSATAATPAVIDTSKDDIATGDIFAIDVDVAGTSTLYAQVLVGVTQP